MAKLHDKKVSETVVLMVPFPAQGHLNQLLHLSRLLSSYNLPINIISTITHARQAKLRIHGWDPLTASLIQFHDFPTPHFPSPPPDPNGSTKFPSHLLPSFEASSHLRDPFHKLLISLSESAKRVVVIFDSLMSTIVQDLESVPKAEGYKFVGCSAFTLLSHLWEDKGRPNLDIDEEVLKETPSIEGCYSREALEFIISRSSPSMKFSSDTICDTSKVFEGEYLKLLEGITNTRVWAMGPFNPVKLNANKRHECLDWLDKQEMNSVIYVSFGTTTSLGDEQILELANGLEASGVKFIWVLRDADRGDIFEGKPMRKIELPIGYEDRLKGKGMVVRDWVPQSEILEHRSTGGFMSHCGWNSCMESITMGVPILAWPMHSDQPRNATLVTKGLKVGIFVRDWETRDELVKSLAVEHVVRRLMTSSEGGDIRLRAAELGGAVRQSMEESGVSRLELDAFAAHITR